MTDFSTYFPFTGGAAAAEADWGLFAQLWATDGVVRGADSELAVTPTGTPDLNVHVAPVKPGSRGTSGGGEPPRTLRSPLTRPFLGRTSSSHA
jgi:hypothetical protein